MNELFKKVPVKIPYSSGFDKSYRHTLTGTTGTLVPIFVDEVIPGDYFIKAPFVLRMPPLASDTYMNVSYKMEAFFVPHRLICKGFERFATGDTNVKSSGGTSGKIRMPVISLTSSDSALYAPGTLLDYLGFKPKLIVANFTVNLNALPLICYGLVWDTWYRNAMVQNSIYTTDTIYNTAFGAANCTSLIPSDLTGVGYQFTSSNWSYADSSKLTDLRQRNFGMDYFTAATRSPQLGQTIGVKLSVNNGAISNTQSPQGVLHTFNNGGAPTNVGPIDTTNYNNNTTQINTDMYFAMTGGFTIASLRAANSLQVWLERNNLAGANRYIDFLKGQYGSDLQDGVAQRPVLIGSASYPVYTSGVLANGEPDPSSNTNNPFNSVASQYGSAHAEGNTFVVKFHASEPGYIMILGSLVPEVTYSSGVDRMFLRYVREDSRTDMANHLLQNVGPQPIIAAEGSQSMETSAFSNIFGFTDRYADWMTKRNQLSGLLHDGSSLESFALQRAFINFSLGTSMLEIPTSYLDQVMAVTNSNAGFSYWADFYFEYKCSMPLQKYSIPSLQDPAYEHGDTVWLNRNGVRID